MQWENTEVFLLFIEAVAMDKADDSLNPEH